MDDNPAQTTGTVETWEEILEDLCAKAEKKARRFEFSSLVVGSIAPRDLDQETAETQRLQVNQAVKKHLLETFPKVRVEPNDPELTLLIDIKRRGIQALASSVFIYGRYLKQNRDIPQTTWHCRKCRGGGCKACDGLGKMYPTSVEEVISEPFQEQTQAKTCKLHGMGREDVDARMMGTGRPFVLEMVHPKSRDIDLEAGFRVLNDLDKTGVAVTNLRLADRSLKRLVKKVEPQKTYLAQVKCGRPLDEEDHRKLADLAPVILDQRTPQRVAHRRADLVRRRQVLTLVTRPRTDPTTIDLELTAEAGTYIKEFITGDHGRTNPALSQILETDCQCEALDVLEIHFDLDETLRLSGKLPPTE